MRDRLWWVGTVKFVGLDQLRLGSYNPDGSQFLDDNFMATVSGKGSWALNDHNQLHATHIYNNKRRYHYAGNATVGFYESRATWDQTLETNLDQWRWTSTLSSRLLLDVSGSFSRTLQDLPPQKEVQQGDIPGLDLLTQTTLAAQPTYTEAHYNRGVVHASLSYVAGTHNLKAGYQWDLGHARTYNYSISHFPVRAAGRLSQRRAGFGESLQHADLLSCSACRRAGCSFRTSGRRSASSRSTWACASIDRPAGSRTPASRRRSSSPAAASPAIDNTPDWLDFAPRLSVIYDVFGDGRTAVKFGANRYMIGIGSGTIDVVNPIRTTFDTRGWTDRNGDLDPAAGRARGLDRLQPGHDQPLRAGVRAACTRPNTPSNSNSSC